MANIYDLNRFIEAHEDDYELALEELKGGRKCSHWMWYIFPQVKGLGKSEMSEYYGIDGIEEAKAYLENMTLGSHMRELCEILLSLETNDASKVFGFPDDLKLKSSMTLFECATADNELFVEILKKYFRGDRDKKTLKIVNIKN